MRAVMPYAVAFAALSLMSVDSFGAVKKNGAANSAPLATPAGVTLKAARVEQGMNQPGQTTRPAYPRLFFADSANKPLYMYDKDEPGKSNCNGECAAVWPPALAPAGSSPFGDWSLIARDDGTTQWAFRGKPLYTYTKEAKPSSDPAGPSGRRNAMGLGPAGHGVDGVWRVIDAQPQLPQLPAAIGVAEVLMAPGQVLTNSIGKTLYTFSGKPSDEKSLSKDWTPVAAPLLAAPIGEFAVIARSDGVYQWSLQGRPLYTYNNDWVLGDANGTDVDSRFELAAVSRYFMPASVAIRKDQRRGGVLITADTKQPLYTRDRVYWDGEGGHNVRGIRGAPAAGEAIGVTACAEECEKMWHPLKAPANAVPSGYWTLYARADGSKQWAYQGFALYTYAEDKPGQVNGHDIFDITVNNSADEKPVPNLGMYWRVVSP